jgi:sugar phosphate isomerase/epimerase
MSDERIRIGGRAGFERLEQLDERFRSIDFPIELALPWRYEALWLPMEDRIDEVVDFFQNRDIEILSLHATQGRITEESFLSWGRTTLELAGKLGVPDVTIHPNRVQNQKEYNQKQVQRMIRRMGGDGIFSIETFGGRKRVYSPHDLVEQGLPMTLDEAHLHDRSFVRQIVDRNHSNIRTVHLSEVGKDEHHLPIDDFCVEVVDQLIDQGWSGNVILEYLPWHHYRVRDDILALREHITSGRRVQLMPGDDKFRGQPDRYGYSRDGTN